MMSQKLPLYLSLIISLTIAGPAVGDEGASRSRGMGGLTEKPSRPDATLLLFKHINDGGQAEIKDGDWLTEADSYAVSFSLKQPAFVYIYQVDAGQRMIRLFPNRKYSTLSNPLAAGRAYRIPAAEDIWFFLDKARGKEQIILLAREHPLSEPDRICREVTDSRYRAVAGKRHTLPYEKDSSLLIKRRYFMHK